jgi:RNA polymerase primary sigma factor
MGKPKVTRNPSTPDDPGPTMPVTDSARGSKHPKARGQNPEPPIVVPAPGKPPSNGQPHIDVAQTVKELVRLAQEQGYLTYNDINEALPDTPTPPEELDDIYVKLRNLEVDIVDQAEVDRIKQPDAEAEDEKGRLDILDDPVRMYLKQMGQVPLLTREQEVEISKRIEAAEGEVKRIVYSFGFAAKEHIALAEKLLSVPPKERLTGSCSTRRSRRATSTSGRYAS